jgi:FAD/FMN-containing dehydrogenase
MSAPTLTPHHLDVAALRRRLAGTLALPGEDAYSRLSSPWNLAWTTSPAVVVEARNAQDVVESVRFAAASGRQVAVQATGHGIAGSLEGTVLVNTARLDECVVHPEGWARVGAGVRWQRVIEAAAVHGLAPLNGSSPNVGVVGYTTGGGIGPMVRTFGAASDRVRAIEVVTGDGLLRRATAAEEPDLFWALRGGKGVAGIVTALEFDLVPVASIYGGAIYFAAGDAGTVWHRWRQWSSTLPEQATTSIAMLQLPPLPHVPAPLAGAFTVAVRFVWTGGVQDGAAAFEAIRSVAPPLLDGVGVMPYTGIGGVHSDPVDPMPAYETAALLSALPAEAVDALLAVAGPQAGSPQVVVEVRQLGGALARPPVLDSALCHRDAAYTLLTIGVPAPPVRDALVAHGAAVLDAMAAVVTGGTLPNWTRATASEFASGYDPATLARLISIVDRYDPAGVVWSPLHRSVRSQL